MKESAAIWRETAYWGRIKIASNKEREGKHEEGDVTADAAHEGGFEYDAELPTQSNEKGGRILRRYEDDGGYRPGVSEVVDRSVLFTKTRTRACT